MNAIQITASKTVEDGNSLPTAAVYSFKNYELNIGYYQDIDSEINVEKCSNLGIKIARRSPGIGGGTIFIDPNSYMNFSLVLRKDFFPDVDEAIKIFGAIVEKTYRNLGVTTARYKHVGDIVVQEEPVRLKLSGLGFGVYNNQLLGMSGFTVRLPNMKLFSTLASIPKEKYEDKGFKTVEEYLLQGITSIEKETGKCPSPIEVKNAFKSAFEETLGVSMTEGILSKEEQEPFKHYSKLFDSDEYRYLVSSKKRFNNIPKDYCLLLGRIKARKLVVSHVLVNRDNIIKDVMFSGDWYGTTTIDDMKKVEKSLHSIPLHDLDKLHEKLNEMFKGAELIGVNTDNFIEAMTSASKVK